MRYIKPLPFRSQYETDDPLDCALWQSDTTICEFNAAGEHCDPSGLYYGTTDEREPKFCARHFYLQVIAEAGTHLIDDQAADVTRPGKPVQRGEEA